MIKTINGSRVEIRHFTQQEMERIDEDYPHPDSSIEAGWYWRELDEGNPPGAPVGPFESEGAALADFQAFLKKFE
jgi:hypothetical protein